MPRPVRIRCTITNATVPHGGRTPFSPVARIIRITPTARMLTHDRRFHMAKVIDGIPFDEWEG